MKKIKITLTVLGCILTSLALALGVASAQAVCIFHFHQPKIPQGMKRYT
jgi:cyclic lactone autoinducer peptide